NCMWAVKGWSAGTPKSSTESADAGIGDSAKPSIATLPTTAAKTFKTFALFIFSPPLSKSKRTDPSKKLGLPGLASLPLREADPDQTRAKQQERGWLRNRHVDYIPASNP